jgi:hypothetical protein
MNCRLPVRGGVVWHKLTHFFLRQLRIFAVEVFDCHFYFVVNGGKGKTLF